MRFAVIPRRNLSPRNVFETLAEETGSQHWMCRIVSGSGTGTRVLPCKGLRLVRRETQVNLFGSRGI